MITCVSEPLTLTLSPEGRGRTADGRPRLHERLPAAVVRRLGECGGHFWAPAAEE